VGTRVVGTWKRRATKGSVHIALHPFDPLDDPLDGRLDDHVGAAMRRYAEFHHATLDPASG
jgi:hypothetical protein